jgi:hypothetical protein
LSRCCDASGPSNPRAKPRPRPRPRQPPVRKTEIAGPPARPGIGAALLAEA